MIMNFKFGLKDGLWLEFYGGGKQISKTCWKDGSDTIDVDMSYCEKNNL